MIPIGVKVRSKMDDFIQGSVQAHVFCEVSTGDPLEHPERKCLVKTANGSVLVVLEDELEVIK